MIKNRIYKLGNSAIGIIFYIFFTLTFFFSLTSVNLIVGDNEYFGMSTTRFTEIFILLILLTGIFIGTFQSIRKFFYFIFVKYGKVTSIIFFMAVVILQILFVYFVHPAIGFDPGFIHAALSDTTNPEIRAYYSMYPNNMFILLAQHSLSCVFNTQSWYFFDMITLFIVDLSSLLNILSIAILNKKLVVGGLYLHSLWLLVFPMIIIPYTDTWVLPLVSLHLLSYIVLSFSRSNFYIKSLFAIFLGVTPILSYYMKPSSIIPIIAIVLVEILFLFKERIEVKKTGVLCILIIIISGAITFQGVGKAINDQKYIAINPERSTPMLHFMNIGLSGEGGYNAEDAFMMGKLPTKKERINYSKKSIIKRLKEKGIVGYFNFLIHKQSNNSADGTFAWQKEGHFISEEDQAVKVTNTTTMIKSFFYLYGEHIADYRFIAQIVWIICLGLIFFGSNLSENYKLVQVLKLGMIGGFMFLLLFEGGRSRYLIQFLPMLLILSSVSAPQAFNRIRMFLHGRIIK